jgi:RNA-directed DNA polymerase
MSKKEEDQARYDEAKAKIRSVGREAFMRDEMLRLGFWPPSEEAARRSEAAEIQLKPLYAEIGERRKELSTIDTEISENQNVPKLLEEIRKRRIARVRAERVVKKEEKAIALTKKAESDRLWRQTALPHLGRGVSFGLDFSEKSDAAKLAQRGLPLLETPVHLAHAMNLTERDLAWLCFHRSASKSTHYALFTIPKRRGGLRVLASPKTKLRIAQRWILATILQKLTPHPAAMAFEPGASVVKNAAPHASKAIIVKLDLRDFFPSIGTQRVKKYFIKLGYNEGVATLLALICTDAPRVAIIFDGQKRFVSVGQRALPQGALTSPALSNRMVSALDARLSGAAKSLGFAYTRYADDLTFSHESNSAPIGALLKLVREIVPAEKLVIHEAKTQVLRKSDQQNITGLVVNASTEEASGPRVSRESLRKFRAVLHQCDRDGFEAVSAKLGKNAQSYAQGYLAFVQMTSAETAKKFTKAHPWLALPE